MENSESRREKFIKALENRKNRKRKFIKAFLDFQLDIIEDTENFLKEVKQQL